MYAGTQRKQRGLAQRLFLIETLEPKEEKVRQYVVMGSTGNVYTVTVTNVPTCTCPDHVTRGNRCKHIFFVLLRIMRVGEAEADVDVYSDQALGEMFSQIPDVTNALRVGGDVVGMYRAKTQSCVTKKDDDLCPVCLEDIQNGEEYDYCRAECGKCVHKICFEMWCRKNPPKCLVCKSAWGEQKYINLSGNGDG